MISRTSVRKELQYFTQIHSISKSFRSFGSAPVLSRVHAQDTMDGDHELFGYTCGRWIYNEEKRLAERRLTFNVDELKKAAAISVSKSESDVKSLRKLAEGGFNRVFEITMRDGASVLARMPYPSTLPRRWAVASEVATMDFVRVHGIPTPLVLGYAIEDNPVGSEYILMEKLDGQPIGDAWFDLPEQQRLQVLHDIVKLETKLFGIRIPASGSIYYTHDLDKTIPKVDIPGLAGRFCVGPYTGLRWWFDRRGDLELDRGPHTEALHVLQAPAQKELTWLRKHGQPRYPFYRQYREAFHYKKQDPVIHATSLEKYLQMCPHLVPTDPELNLPVLRHPDVQPNNIFISKDHRVTGLIDWQHSTVLPTFLAAGIPNSFQNYHDAESRTFTPPRLPGNFDSLSGFKRTQAQEDFRRRQIHFYYLGFTQRFNERHWRALDQDSDLLRRRVFDHAGEPWEGFNTTLQYDLVQIAKNWDKVSPRYQDGTASACPVSFTEEEEEQITALEDLHHDADGDVERINELLGIASDGWTSNERFESAKSEAAEIRRQALASVENDPYLSKLSEQHWPFDDHDENE